MPQVYLLANAVNDLLTLISEAEDPAAIAEYQRLLEETEAELDKRIAGMCAWVRNLELEIEDYEEEVKRLREEKSTREKKVERIKNYIGALIGKGNKWSMGVHKVGWRKSKALLIDEDATPHPAFVKIIEEHDKDAIRQHLDGGGTLPYARYEERQNVQVK